MNARAPRATPVSKSVATALEVAPWDKIAPIRAADLDRGTDPSYAFVIRPTIMSLVGRTRTQHRAILDIGCGVGRLTKDLVGRGDHVIGIDPSPVSASIAAAHAGSHAHIINSSIGEYVTDQAGAFDVCVASMVMQDVVDVDEFLMNARDALVDNGRLVACITHPFFWPAYWKYDQSAWFQYSKELFIKSQFRTSKTDYPIDTLHVHRPLQQYVDALSRAGFRLRRLVEPVMPAARQRQSGVAWTHPHFLFLEACAE